MEENNSNKYKKIIADIVCESWRFCNLFERILSKQDAGEKSKYLNKYNWYKRKLEESLSEAELTIVDLEGKLYEPGLAATPLNLDEFNKDDSLIVDQMIEPTIMGPDGLLKMGVITLKKKRKK